MAFDIDMIKKVYASYPEKIAKAREILQRPLTLTEKILYAHLHVDSPMENYPRGNSSSE